MVNVRNQLVNSVLIRPSSTSLAHFYVIIEEFKLLLEMLDGVCYIRK